jgi:RNA polymerase sigma factor (sigma-70 family)
MPTQDAPSDSELIERCRAGHQTAWNALVRRFQRIVYTVPRRAGLPDEVAADVFQTVFARLFEHLDRIDDPSRIHAWLVTTAKRETLRLLEQSKRITDLHPATGAAEDDDDSDPLDRLPSDDPLPEQLLSDLQQQDRVRRAVSELDDKSRQLVELLFLQEEPPSYAEIAARLGIPEGSIGPTRARCLDKLRAILRKS